MLLTVAVQTTHQNACRNGWWCGGGVRSAGMHCAKPFALSWDHRLFCMQQPLDVTKTRLQLDNAGRYRGMIHCGTTIFKEEGALALYKGLTPFITHLTLKYALRFGAFASFKSAIAAISPNEALGNFTVRN